MVFTSLPPVTRCCFIASTALMVATSLEVVSPLSLYMSYNLVFYHFQLWRLFTSFLFFGSFSMQFLWNMYLGVYYCSTLEEPNKPASFLWLLFTTASMLLALSYLFGVNTFFYSSSMFTVLTYIWGRRNPHARMSILFLTVEAPYLSYLMAIMSALVGWQFLESFIGIFAGHIYFFFQDVFPLLPCSNGIKILQPPVFVKRLLNEAVD